MCLTKRTIMEDAKGTWRGEYRINYGTEEQPNSQYFHFQVRIKSVEDGFEGVFKDLTLKTIDSQLHGFLEGNFISFVRKAQHSKEFVEFLNISVDHLGKPTEFVFNGNWNQEDESFQGVWEVEIEEEKNSFQTDVYVESKTGEWYMRKF